MSRVKTNTISELFLPPLIALEFYILRERNITKKKVLIFNKS